VLRRMKRFGSADAFLALLGQARALAPDLGARSNVIVGFPGETEADLAELEHFLALADLDAIGVFGYSDEERTAAADLDDKLDADEVAARVEHVAMLADELVAQRAAERVGATVEVLIEQANVGRAVHQGPDDGVTQVPGARRGELVTAVVTDTDGVDLTAVPRR
jgi:ribosomal protein S12 methylthiotransferase